jgi:FRG domain
VELILQQELWSFYDSNAQAQKVGKLSTIRNAKGHLVRNYLELAKKIAELQFRNREYVLLFRGQRTDYKNREKNTSLKPSLFRPLNGNNPGPDILLQRFDTLRAAERSLIAEYGRRGLPSPARLQRHRVLRWAILQHYEVCLTPLLDVTHSLRIAASFASEGASESAYLFVVGVPNLSGAITASAEAGLQIVRLSSVCPPVAVRPHIQEGYLLGEYPDLDALDQKALYDHYEIDFGRRLVAKFRFNPSTFWKNSNFPKIGKRALYPSRAQDQLCRLAEDVKAALSPQ